MVVSHDNGLGWFIVMGTEVPDLELTRGTGRENLHLHSAGQRRHGSIVSIIWNKGRKRERKRERRERGERERERRERDACVNYT